MATPATPSKPARGRRTRSYWEPIYEPNCKEAFPNARWADAQKHGASARTLAAGDLEAELQQGIATRFSGVAFKNCDFFGHFDKIDRTLIFEQCEFDFCDFGLSTWRRAKFTNCRFRHSSLTQCTLIECEFRKCTWESIGLSGNETRFERTYVDNPCALVDSKFLNLHVKSLGMSKANRGREIVRHWETKSTVARQLYNDLKFVGDERAFYEACRCFLLCSAKHSLWNSRYPGKDADGRDRRASLMGLAAASLELTLFHLFGILNKWGASVSRPLMALVAVFAIFVLIYWTGYGIGFAGSVAKSFEITSVAGYTPNPNAPRLLRLTEWLNLVLAIIAYTVFFATAVAKIARVR